MFFAYFLISNLFYKKSSLYKIKCLDPATENCYKLINISVFLGPVKSLKEMVRIKYEKYIENVDGIGK